MLTEFEDVFEDKDQLRVMKGPPMKIHLKNDYEPYRITAARPIPFAQRDKVKKKLEDMV